jgi:UDP-glucose-4-epimerase GalE
LDLPNRAHILVTGGAGYIGSHTVKLLRQRGFQVSIVDNLSRGHQHNIGDAAFYQLDLSDAGELKELMTQLRPAAVIHFAAYIAVGESMRVPELYFTNNTGGSLSLLNAMVHAGVCNLVFSSTAAVYGMPPSMPILEDFPIAPVNAYGESKVLVERMLRWFDEIHGLRSMVLRYFNASGSDPEGQLGEEHEPETHLLPLLLRAVLTGSPATVFGEDYDTPDGTCIRDYIHVWDLAEAHILAVEALLAGAPSSQFNVGTGRGYSVMEVIRAVQEVTGKKVPYSVGPRRDGDPRALVANADKLRRTLGWTPRHSELPSIVGTAWRFACRSKR